VFLSSCVESTTIKYAAEHLKDKRVLYLVLNNSMSEKAKEAMSALDNIEEFTFSAMAYQELITNQGFSLEADEDGWKRAVNGAIYRLQGHGLSRKEMYHLWKGMQLYMKSDALEITSWHFSHLWPSARSHRTLEARMYLPSAEFCLTWAKRVIDWMKKKETPLSFGMMLKLFHLTCPKLEDKYDVCIAEGTPINVSSGVSIPIEQVRTGQRVLSFDGQSSSVTSDRIVHAAMDNGVKPCIELLFEDGRTLTCTEDHRILTLNGWKPAGELQPGYSSVIVGAEYPMSPFGEDEENSQKWTLDLTSTLGYQLDMKKNRGKAMAFARLFGYLLADGSISTYKSQHSGQLMMGNELDVQSMSRDINELTGLTKSSYTSSLLNGTTFNINVPAGIIKSCVLLGAVTGRRIGVLTHFPAFILDGRCPKSIVREFVGGLFGGDGGSPTVIKKVMDFTGVMFSQSKRGLIVREQSEIWTEELFSLLQRLDMKTDGIGVSIVRHHDIRTMDGVASIEQAREHGLPITATIREDHILDPDASYSVRFCFPTDLTLPFHRNVGFRHCSNKQMRLSAASACYRAKDIAISQRQWISKRALQLMTHDSVKVSAALSRARLEFAERGILHPYAREFKAHSVRELNRKPFGSGRPAKGYSMRELIQRFNILHFFAQAHVAENAVEGRAEGVEHSVARSQAVTARGPVQYATSKTGTTLPTFQVGLIGMRDVGLKRVYDLSVPGNPSLDDHSFMANSIVVHNCILDEAQDVFEVVDDTVNPKARMTSSGHMSKHGRKWVLVYVGDRWQAINRHLGGVNALERRTWTASYYFPHSKRFGTRIATLRNEMFRVVGIVDDPVIGNPERSSTYHPFCFYNQAGNRRALARGRAAAEDEDEAGVSTEAEPSSSDAPTRRRQWMWEEQTCRWPTMNDMYQDAFGARAPEALRKVVAVLASTNIALLRLLSTTFRKWILANAFRFVLAKSLQGYIKDILSYIHMDDDELVQEEKHALEERQMDVLSKIDYARRVGPEHAAFLELLMEQQTASMYDQDEDPEQPIMVFQTVHSSKGSDYYAVIAARDLSDALLEAMAISSADLAAAHTDAQVDVLMQRHAAGAARHQYDLDVIFLAGVCFTREEELLAVTPPIYKLFCYFERKAALRSCAAGGGAVSSAAAAASSSSSSVRRL
jgi:hypothetical protein